MNVLLEKRKADAEATPSSPVGMDIRHLAFDACAGHDLKANGIYNVARRLAAEQLAAGESARIMFLREKSREMPNEPSDLPMDVLTLAGREVLRRRVSINSDILEALTAGDSRAQFFHIHSARQPLLVPIVWWLRKRGIPYAMTIHGRYSHVFDDNKSLKRRLSTLYLRQVERRILEGAQFVQGVSAAECDIIRRIAPKARVILVPNAAYSSHFEGVPPAPGRTAPSSRYPVFGYLGRYEIQHKGLDLLIAGFARYRAAGGKGVLELAGTGPAREQVAALARDLGVADFVTIDGPRFGEDKTRTLASWDYFVMPSRFEGVPIGALEAGLAGLPLLVSVETGLRESVNEFHAGVGIDALTPDAVAQAMTTAERYNAGEWASMSEAAYRMALSIGDWTAISARLSALYRRG
jgi:glycosyltransferase involved in cell wall biosynthesis